MLIDLGLELRRKVYLHLQCDRLLGNRRWHSWRRVPQLLSRTSDPALYGLARWVLLRQRRHQALPVADGVGVALLLECGDTEQAEGRNLLRIAFERLVGQSLEFLAPLTVIGEVARLSQLSKQLRLPPRQCDHPLECLGRVGRALLTHVGAPEEVPPLGRIRLGFDGLLETHDHLLHRTRLLGELASQQHLVTGAPMQIQTKAQQGHQKRQDQRHRASKATATLWLSPFGIAQQLARSIGLACLVLRLGKRTCRELRGQFVQALLIERDVQCSTVFFGLRLAATHDRQQQNGKGRQQQQAGSDPEIGHGSFLSSREARRWRSASVRVWAAGVLSTRRRRTMMNASTPSPRISSAAGPYQSSSVVLVTGGR